MNSRKTSALLPSNFNLSTRWLNSMPPQRSEASKIEQNDMVPATAQVICIIIIADQMTD